MVSRPSLARRCDHYLRDNQRKTLSLRPTTRSRGSGEWGRSARPDSGEHEAPTPTDFGMRSRRSPLRCAPARGAARTRGAVVADWIRGSIDPLRRAAERRHCRSKSPAVANVSQLRARCRTPPPDGRCSGCVACTQGSGRSCSYDDEAVTAAGGEKTLQSTGGGQ